MASNESKLEDTGAEEYYPHVLAALPTARTSFLPDTTKGILFIMQAFVTVWSLSLFFTLAPLVQRGPVPNQTNQRAPGTRQLAAVRGEIVKIATPSKGMLLISVRPAKEFPEITVLARENDLVGTAVGRSGEADLLGLLADDTHDDETITAAELNQGDIISVIYDPQLQNRVLEIYLH